MTSAVKHHCHAHKCKSEVPPRLFMCPEHWKMVPDSMKREINRTYRKRQERDKNPSLEYVIATGKAKIYIAEKEYPDDVEGLKKICRMIENAFAKRQKK